ncbi:RHS repeat domain-containing protein [Flavobacterium selenitireducens]|uniref:RHS repeat domain-containing protein n=1 Tax=Flavobacterium selenitireducens TaxID=2722704 RepID=UPI00168BC4DC|nr:RHS repeat domain-containing protein [Flavobacterium selenitireducens]MBD3583321.1 RHS repeat protein [Flavobacterium selenitireducens]
MRATLLLFSILFFASCTSDDAGSATAPDPTLLQRVVFYPENANTSQVWDFDQQGFLMSISKPDGTILQNFSYDAGHNLTSTTYMGVTYEFSYDAQDRLSSVNGLAVSFDEATNTYAAILGEPDPTSEDPIPHRREWHMDSSMLLKTEVDHFTWVLGEGTDMRSLVTYDATGNLKSMSDLDMIYGGFTHDSHTNPLRHATLPITRAMSLLLQGWSPDFRLKFISSLHNSTNNILSEVHNPEDPESSEFEYLYNANGLPQSSIAKSYYLGNFEGQTQLAQYYYQGDTLP